MRGNWNGYRGNGNNWSGNRGNWNGGRGNWYGRHDWDGYFNGGVAGGWGWGGYSPWYSGWDWGWGSPYVYSAYSYPDTGYYPTYYPTVNNYYTDGGSYPSASGYYPSGGYNDYSYAPDDYYSGANVAVDPGAAVPQAADVPPQPAPTAAAEQSGTPDALQYYSEARADFLQGDYQNTLRLAGHAELEAPENPRVHELLSLALFASGNYTAAASEAHAAMAMGPIAEWTDLYSYYNDVNKYTTQLRALEKAAANNPKSAADHYLLGYQYLMMGARPSAQAQFADAVELAPNDKLAAHYLAELKANSPLTPPQITAPPQTATKVQSATPRGQVL